LRARVRAGLRCVQYAREIRRERSEIQALRAELAALWAERKGAAGPTTDAPAAPGPEKSSAGGGCGNARDECGRQPAEPSDGRKDAAA
jgi:hypothetical protein